MSKEFFEPRRTTGKISLTLSNKKKWVADKPTICQHIIDTVAKYERQGYRLTLRQLYYQLVAADHIPNDDVVYKKMSSVLDDLRYSGRVAWDAIEDRGRVPYRPYWASGPADAMNDIIRQYRLDRMEGQPILLEGWTEKDAISGILKRVTSEFHVHLVVNKGYSSSSAMHAAYLRFSEAINRGQKVKILYFGDHDPSGLDMLRDIEERILFFLAAGTELDWDKAHRDDHKDLDEKLAEWWEGEFNIWDLTDGNFLKFDIAQRMIAGEGTSEDDDAFEQAQKMKYLKENWFEVVPIGLTREQIDEYNPPPNPAKITDPRAKWYIQEHGEVSWEVDALPPDVMASIVRYHIVTNLDQEIYDQKLALEKQHIAKMRAFAEGFEN